MCGTGEGRVKRGDKVREARGRSRAHDEEEKVLGGEGFEGVADRRRERWL